PASRRSDHATQPQRVWALPFPLGKSLPFAGLKNCPSKTAVLTLPGLGRALPSGIASSAFRFFAAWYSDASVWDLPPPKGVISFRTRLPPPPASRERTSSSNDLSPVVI